MQKKIEGVIVQTLDTCKDPSTVETAAKMYPLLPQCGGGGNKGVKYTEAWTSHTSRLLASLHQTLDMLYANVETGKLQSNKN